MWLVQSFNEVKYFNMKYLQQVPISLVFVDANNILILDENLFTIV